MAHIIFKYSFGVYGARGNGEKFLLEQDIRITPQTFLVTDLVSLVDLILVDPPDTITIVGFVSTQALVEFLKTQQQIKRASLKPETKGKNVLIQHFNKDENRANFTPRLLEWDTLRVEESTIVNQTN